MRDYLTTADVAKMLNVTDWRVRRVYELGLLPDPPRFAGKRAIPSKTLPALIDALRSRGWLPAVDVAPSVEEVAP